MTREFSRQRILFTLALDWLGSLAVLLAAVWLRTGWLPVTGRGPAGWLTAELNWEGVFLSGWPGEILPGAVFLYVAGLWPYFLYVFGVYDGQRNGSFKAELLNVLLAVSVATLTLAGLLFFSFRGTSRLLILQFYVLDLGLLAGLRVVLGLYGLARRRWVRPRRTRVLLVGGGMPAQWVLEQLRQPAWAAVQVVGRVDEAGLPPDDALSDIPHLGGLDEVVRAAHALEAKEAVVALPWTAFERISELAEALWAHGVRVHVAPDPALLMAGQSLSDGAGRALGGAGQAGIYGARRQFKRALDVLGATLGLLACLPLLLIIVIAIKLDSRGPVLYRQQRIGENGRPFTMLKFRTMRAGADPGLHQAHVARLIRENLPPNVLGQAGSLKLENDPRITRVGAWLRKSSLDELPQLINVLVGEMSLVGPRPPLAYEVALYQDWHKRRLAAPPGMTGLWQVRGRNRVNFDDMVRMDLEYIDQHSLWLDLQLLLQTPLAVVSGHGAG